MASLVPGEHQNLTLKTWNNSSLTADYFNENYSELLENIKHS